MFKILWFGFTCTTVDKTRNVTNKIAIMAFFQFLEAFCLFELEDKTVVTTNFSHVQCVNLQIITFIVNRQDK